MYTTEIRIADGDFMVRMSDMRIWLDSRRFEPAVFRYNHVDDGVVVHVEFALETEAAAFAEQFGGTLMR